MAKAQDTFNLNDEKVAELEIKRAKNREYQRKYREKAKDRLVIVNGRKKAKRADLKRLDVYLPAKVKQDLEQLAYSQRKTQAELIEEWVNRAYEERLNKLTV